MAENNVRDAFRRSLTPKEKPQSQPPQHTVSQFSVMLSPEDTIVFDRLTMVVRHKTKRPIRKAEIVRTMISLATDDPAFMNQIAEEIIAKQQAL